MRLLLVRHAEAEDARHGLSDVFRALTRSGLADARVLGRTLARHEQEVSSIYMSGLVRAVQTAQLLAEGLKFEGALEVLTDLVPGGSADEALAFARTLSGTAAFVGHEPQMSELGTLATGGAFSDTFRKGMLLAVDLPPRGAGQLLYTLVRDRLTKG